jgi:hypothetical protein
MIKNSIAQRYLALASVATEIKYDEFPFIVAKPKEEAKIKV